jgi:hypothetical protein
MTSHRESQAVASRGRRGGREWAVSLIALVLGVLYFVLFLLVRQAEAGADENTFGAYVFLSLIYLGLAGALVVRPGVVTYTIGLFVQIAVLVLFVVFAVGLLGPGVFDYDLVSDLRMPLWATATTALQIGLIVLLVGLIRHGSPAEVDAG